MWVGFVSSNKGLDGLLFPPHRQIFEKFPLVGHDTGTTPGRITRRRLRVVNFTHFNQFKIQ